MQHALTAIAVLGLASSSLAQLRFEYGVDLSVEDLVDTERFVNDNAQVIQLGIDDPPFGRATGTSHVGTGVNKAGIVLDVDSSSTDPLVIGYANAYAYWYDQVTISHPTLNGSVGSFTTSMLVNGSGAAAASGGWLSDPMIEMGGVWHAFVGVFLADSTMQEDGWFGYWEADPTTGQLEYGGAPLGQVQASLTFDFIFGEPFTLSGRLQSYFDVFNPEGASGALLAEIDLSNSAYWAGISAIHGGAGQTVTDAVISSASGVQWQSSINPGALRGDFDGTGLVDIGDFAILASAFNQNRAPWTGGDATGDGLVSIADFAIVASNFNQTVPRAAVPEPTWALLATMAWPMLRRMRRGA